MAKSPLRYKRLIREIPKHDNAQDALIAAGFSENTAKHQAKRVMGAALRHVAEEIASGPTDTSLTSKQLMSDIVGLSGADVMERLRFIATQEKDLHSALKVLMPLARQHNVLLNDDEGTVTVPILNIVVDKPDDNMALLSPSEVVDVEV